MPTYTWVGTTSDWGTASNWSPASVPLPSDDVVFNNNKPCSTNGTNRTVKSIDFTGYTSVLTMLDNITVNGNVTLQAAQSSRLAGTGTLIVGNTSTITPNGGTWSNKLQLGVSSNFIITLASSLTVTGDLSFSGTVGLNGNVSINCNSTTCTAIAGCVVYTTTTAPTTLVFGGASTTWTGAGRIGCYVQIASGNIILSGSVFFGSIQPSSQSPIFTYTAATSVTTTGSTLGIIGSCTFTAGGMTFNNVNLLTGNQGLTYNITLTENLNVGGNFETATDGNGSHTISRTASQVINVSGNLTIASNIRQGSLNASTSTGAKIVMLGNASGTSTISGSRIGFASSGSANWCNIDLEIAAGSNTVALSTVNEFNFGNTSTVSPISYRTLKYTSGTFTTAGSIINLGNSILDLGAAQLNNVRIYPTGSSGTNYVVQLISDVTITGSLSTGTTGNNYGGGQIINGGAATSLNIQGGLSVGTSWRNPLSGGINLRFKTSGSLVGVAHCLNNIFFDSGTYTIGNFVYGNNVYNGTASEMTYVGGTVSASGTLLLGTVLFDIAGVQLDNVSVVTSGSASQDYTLTIKSAFTLRINGNFSTGTNLTGNTQYGGVIINNHPSTPSTQMDVYGNLTIGTGVNPNYQPIGGNSKIYLKGTGTLTSGTPLTLFNSCGINLFIDGVNYTLGNVVMTGGKKIEYVSGTFTTTGSLTTIYGSATIKSNGALWGDVGVRGLATFTIDGNLSCRDFITYADGGSITYITGNTFILTIRRNLTLGNNSPLANGFPAGTNPLAKIVMTATETGTGTWTSNSQYLYFPLDLNAPTGTIAISGNVFYGNSTNHTIKYFAGTTISAAGSTFYTQGATLDLSNQTFGNIVTTSGTTINLVSAAKFVNATFGSGAASNINLNSVGTTQNFTISGNYLLNSTGSLLTTGISALLIFDGNGSWTSTGTTAYDIQIASGTRTLVGAISWGGNKTLTATGGSLVSTGSTFNIIGSNTISVDKTTVGSFNNVNTQAGVTITLNAQMGINGLLALSNTAGNTTTFASSGTFGWDAVNFTHGGGNTICILNAGSTYNVSGTFTMLGTSNSVRATLRSSKLASFNGLANGTNLTVSAPIGGSPIQSGMVISQASGVAVGTFATLLPNRPIINGGAGLSWTLDPLYPVTPPVGTIAMEGGVKANFNLAAGTGNALVLNATTKDINSIGGQTIYAFQTYTDAPTNPQADLYRTINWNSLLPPASPIGVGFLSVT